MSFFSFKKKDNLSLVFYISGTSVSAAAVSFVKKEKPTIILSKSLEIKVFPNYTSLDKINLMVESIDQIIISINSGLAKIGEKRNISKYYFAIASPWSVSRSKTIKIIKDKIFSVDEKLIDRIISGEETISIEQLTSKSEEKEWEILEEKIIKSKINDYIVESIINKKTNNLEIDTLVSFVPSKVKEKLLHMLDHKSISERQIKANSSLLPHFSFIKDEFEGKRNFIYFNISERITEVTIVKEESISASGSIPIGSESIIDSIIEKTGLTRQIVASTLNINCRGECHPSSKQNEELFDIEIGNFFNKINTELFSSFPEIELPKDVFIFINNDLIEYMVKRIASDPNKLKLLTKDIRIKTIKEEMLNNFINNAKFFRNQLSLKVAVLFFNKLNI